MWQLPSSAWRRLTLRLLCARGAICCAVFVSAALVGSPRSSSAEPIPRIRQEKDKDRNKAAPLPSIVRWDEQQPGCTFSRGDDGKYHYGLWSGDVGIVLAVDAREVQLVRHRIEPIFGVLLEIHYQGAANLDATADPITLQFMKHLHVVQS